MPTKSWNKIWSTLLGGSVLAELRSIDMTPPFQQSRHARLGIGRVSVGGPGPRPSSERSELAGLASPSDLHVPA